MNRPTNHPAIRPMIRSDLVPNGRHLRIQHTYSWTMISAFLIQQERRRGRRVLRQRDGAPEVGDDLVSAGLRPSSAETRCRGKTVEVCGRAAVEKSSQISPKTSVYIGGREGRRQPQNLKVWPKLEVEESYSNPTWSRIPPSHLETLSTLCFFLLKPYGP